MNGFEEKPFSNPLSKSEGLSERVYRALLQMLSQGTLRRGGVLRIDLLAKALDVSSTPVREALARLATTGLVQHESRKGYMIAPPLDIDQLRELIDARRLIEVASIGRACENGGNLFIYELSAALQVQRKAVAAFNDASSTTDRQILAWNVMEADLNFHHTIFKNTGNRFIPLMANALSAQLHRIRQSVQAGISDDFDALREHDAIMAAVEAGDRQGAERAMNDHIENIKKRSEADLAH